MSTTHLAPPHGSPHRGRPGVPPPGHRDSKGRFILGPRLTELASAAGEDISWLRRRPVLWRLCATRPTSRRSSTARGRAHLWPMPSAESGCVTPFPWAPPCPCRVARHWVLSPGRARPPAPALSVDIREWAQSSWEREPGVASVSAPVRGPGGSCRGRDHSLRTHPSGWGVSPARFTDTWSWPRRVDSPGAHRHQYRLAEVAPHSTLAVTAAPHRLRPSGTDQGDTPVGIDDASAPQCPLEGKGTFSLWVLMRSSGSSSPGGWRARG